MMTAPQLTEFLKHYGDNPFERPKDRIPEFFQTVDENAWARTPERQMSVAGAVSAFMELYPVDQRAWRIRYPHVFDMVMRVIRAHSVNPDHAGWVPLHLTRWFITRNVGEIDQLLKLAGRGGNTGYVASAAIELTSKEFPVFADAVKVLQRGAEIMVTVQ